MHTVAEWNSHFFERHHVKSSIFERLENFQNDCCSPWTKTLFKNLYSTDLRIINAVVMWLWFPASQIDWVKFIFLQTKATHLMLMTYMYVNEVNNNKTKEHIRWIQWLSWYTIDVHVRFLIITTAAYVHGNEQLHLRFSVIVFYFVVLVIDP